MMNPMGTSGYWRRILVVNAIGAVAAFGLLGGLVADASWAVRLRALAISFVYSNCIGSLGAIAIPKLLARRRRSGQAREWALRLVATAALIVAGCFIGSAVLVVLRLIEPREFLEYARGSLWIAFLVGGVLFVTVSVYFTLRGQLEQTSLALRTKERDEAEARRLAAEAQLASLEARVEPHFLFNTLNSIAELIHENPKGAERMTGQLASLLRASLDEQPGRLIPLRDELAVVRDYLDIERVRFGDRLSFEVAVDHGLGGVRVPRLAVQTLVENSIKHAVSLRRERVELVIRAAADNGHVSVAVEDNGPGFDPTSLPEGHGLTLLRSRLAMAFGDRAALRIDSRRGRTCVTIELPA
jgi:signal transduction histidine kinase